MLPRSPFFPKQLFLRFVSTQLFLLLPILLFTLIGTRIFFHHDLKTMEGWPQFASSLDRLLILMALFWFTVVIAVTIWTGYRFMLPLGRIMNKARSIQRKDYNPNAHSEESLEDPNEWSDLESALHRIGQEIRRKDLSLSQEREQIEAVMGALSESVVAVDRSGTMLFFNSRFALLFGKGIGSRPRMSDCIRNPDILEAFRETIRTGEPSQISSQIRIQEEFTPRHFALSIAPLRRSGEKPYGAVGVFLDITELRRMDQVRIDFVANVSHELRTPLTAIKGYTQTLKDDASPQSPNRKFLETIERNTDRLIALVQDLLQLSSLESGGEIGKEKIFLSELTQRVLSQLEPIKNAMGHEIVKTLKAETLNADPRRVEQVLYNLLENAIKYVPPRGKIEVSWAQDNHGVYLSVADNGPGIPLEYRERVFERFYRVDSARSRDQGGTGLGLSIVKHIMQRHGGKIWIEEGPEGKGARFSCFFPSEMD